MFREPLAPIEMEEDFRSYLSTINQWLDSGAPFTAHETSAYTVDEDSLASTLQILPGARAGMVIFGQLPDTADREAALALADRLRWPVFADITSGARLGSRNSCVIPFFNLALTSESFNQAHRPDIVLHIGDRVVSKRLMQWLEGCPELDYVQIINHPFRIDPIHRVTHRVETDIASFCRALADRLPPAGSERYLKQWSGASDSIQAILNDRFSQDGIAVEASLARLLSSEVHQGSALFLASSMPIRDMDIFAAADGLRVPIAANRGVSGIDGTVASASGYAAGLNKPVTLLIGDLALLHDLNSLALLAHSPQPVMVVVVNNNGGGIFDHLPISKFGALFEKYFVTPHGFRFEHAAKQFGLSYSQVSTIPELGSEYRNAQSAQRSSIIEVAVDRAENMRFHNLLIQEIGTALKST
jgi:2-succinyl-5-enolpyruvyl-6-hydroxy-3-cyclohexene-1-carboxylate synthase